MLVYFWPRLDILPSVMNALFISSLKPGGFLKTQFSICAQLKECKRYLSVSRSCGASDKPDVKTTLDDDDYGTEEKEQKIEKMRNKSRLKTNHRNQLFGKKPFTEPVYEHHFSVKYNRQMFGRYGLESGVNPGLSWPTKDDLINRQEYEKVAFPFTVKELVESANKDLEMRELEIQESHNRVLENLSKLDKWKKDLKEKIVKKEAEALAAKEKKQKLIEEVRRHFGFTIDPKDERFKEMVAIKEKEQKKKDKLAKLEEREKKAIAKLMSKNEIPVSDSSESTNK